MSPEITATVGNFPAKTMLLAISAMEQPSVFAARAEFFVDSSNSLISQFSPTFPKCSDTLSLLRSEVHLLDRLGRLVDLLVYSLREIMSPERDLGRCDAWD